MEPVLIGIEAKLDPEKPIGSRAFSAKIVKRMLVATEPQVADLFQPSRGSKPKLLHITPLYTVNEGKTKTVLYTSSVTRGYYKFYVGALDTEEVAPLLDAVYSLAWLDSVQYAGSRIRVRITRIEKLNVTQRATDAIQALAEHGRIKIILASPTLLRDPLIPSKYKTLIPSIMNLFATPVYINLYSRGRLRSRTYRRTLLRLHRALSIPPTFLGTSKKPGTLRRLDLAYEPGRRVPTLIGYVNIYYNKENDPNRVALELLEDILPYMLALGTGVGRAAGLGHIDLQCGKVLVGFLWSIYSTTIEEENSNKPNTTETHKPEESKRH